MDPSQTLGFPYLRVDMTQLVYGSLPFAPVCWCRCWRITEAQLQMLMVANWLQTFGLGIWPNDLSDVSHMQNANAVLACQWILLRP